MRFFTFLMFQVVFSLQAAEVLEDNNVENEALVKNQILEAKLLELQSQYNLVNVRNSKLVLELEKGISAKRDMQEKLENIINATNELTNNEAPLRLEILQSTNLYVFALPLVTIFLVLGGTYIQLKTLKVKSKETLDALIDSNKTQLLITEKNNSAEREKSREAIISNNRQNWINSLRDEVASLISSQVQYHTVSPSQSDEVFADIMQRLYKVELLLNPNEDLHKKLFELLTEASSLCVYVEDRKKLMSKKVEIATVTKTILKQEWGRVKTFDL